MKAMTKRERGGKGIGDAKRDANVKNSPTRVVLSRSSRWSAHVRGILMRKGIEITEDTETGEFPPLAPSVNCVSVDLDQLLTPWASQSFSTKRQLLSWMNDICDEVTSDKNDRQTFYRMRFILFNSKSLGFGAASCTK